MWTDFLDKLNPVFSEDLAEWSETSNALKTTYGTNPGICWYASSGLDFTPIATIHRSYIYQPNRSLMIMSDYDKQHISTIKTAYERLGEEPIYNSFGQHYKNIGKVIQMISLSLWISDEIEKFNNYNFSLQ